MARRFNEPVVLDGPCANERMQAAAYDAVTRVGDGGLDANYLNAKGVPTVTLGAGQHKPHTIDEYVDVQRVRDRLPASWPLSPCAD